MRFVIDANNAIGLGGCAIVAGFGWSAGCWLWSKFTQALKI